MSDEIGTEDLRTSSYPITKADPDQRAFANHASDARPKPGTSEWNDYAWLFNAIGQADVRGDQRLRFSTRHFVADYLFKLGFRVRVPLVDYLERYVESRNIDMPFYTNGSKIREEGDELIAALKSGDVERIMEEAADVTITALVAARQHGFSLEEALELKIAKDAGRGLKVEQCNMATGEHVIPHVGCILR